jgi:alpha-tubulin suppressor-like RCC1 family protein/uncharacterized protein YjdB
MGRQIIAIAGVALFAACTDRVGPSTTVERPTGVIASNPIPVGVAVSGAQLGASLSAASPSADDSVAYVSLTPGTAPSGSSATIRRIGSTSSFQTGVFDGGFDPVPVIAGAGDSIEVVIRNAGGGIVTLIGLRVAARRPPVVVRTQPPPRKRDHPLNAAIVLVFDEPLAGSSEAPGSVRLLRGQSAVPGTVRFLDPSLDANHVSMEFVPDAPLEAGVTYQLVATTLIRDLSGDALATPDTVEFTTSQSVTGPPATLTLSIDSVMALDAGATRQLTAIVRDSAGTQLTDEPVTWSSTNTAVVTVSSTGLVHAVAPGNAFVNASAGQVDDHLWIVVTNDSPRAAVTIDPPRDTIAVGRSVTLTATVRDASGIAIPSAVVDRWSSSDSLVASVAAKPAPNTNLNAAIGRRSGTVTVTVAAYPGLTGTAVVTVVSRLASLIVSPDRATLVPSSSMRFAVTLNDSTGAGLTGYQVAWTSDSPAVATVDTDGLVTAVAPGSTTISATSEGITATAHIVVAPVSFASVSVGLEHTCGVTPGGAAYCWGDNYPGELGLGDGVDQGVYFRATPVPVIGGFTFADVRAGDDFTCGITTAGVGYCWGYNYHGQLGRGYSGGPWPTYGYATPDTLAANVAGVLNFATLSVGFAHTCAVTTQSTAYCWGANVAYSPVAVSGGLSFAALSVGGAHTCGITTGGATYCWGLNYYGQLGDSTTTNHTTPVAVLGGLLFATVSAGASHTCGVTSNGAAYCWGGNASGQLGDSTATNRAMPVAVSGGLSFATLSAGANHTCGVSSTGTGYCWGNNANGQIGDGTMTFSAVPVPVAGGLAFASVSAGGDQTCGITPGGVLYCWGSNYHGMLGDGTTVDRATPVKVLGQP